MCRPPAGPSPPITVRLPSSPSCTLRISAVLADAQRLTDRAMSCPSVSGGGYSWRLCKRPPGPSDNTKLSGEQASCCPPSCASPLTAWCCPEKCFQQIPLTFVGSNHTVIGCAGYNKTHCTHPTSVSIARMTTTNGTHPSHSEWARNPIPACGDLGSGGARGDCKYPPQFPEPAPGKPNGCLNAAPCSRFTSHDA